MVTDTAAKLGRFVLYIFLAMGLLALEFANNSWVQFMCKGLVVNSALDTRDQLLLLENSAVAD